MELRFHVGWHVVQRATRMPRVHSPRWLCRKGAVRAFATTVSADPWKGARSYGQRLVSPSGEGPAVALDSVKSRSAGGELDDCDGGGSTRHEHLLPVEFAFSLSL